jgi:hypothetical protein
VAPNFSNPTELASVVIGLLHYVVPPSGQLRERFSFAEIHVLELGNRSTDGVNRKDFLQILPRKIAHDVAIRGQDNLFASV